MAHFISYIDVRLSFEYFVSVFFFFFCKLQEGAGSASASSTPLPPPPGTNGYMDAMAELSKARRDGGHANRAKRARHLLETTADKHGHAAARRELG